MTKDDVAWVIAIRRRYPKAPYSAIAAMAGWMSATGVPNKAKVHRAIRRAESSLPATKSRHQKPTLTERYGVAKTLEVEA